MMPVPDENGVIRVEIPGGPTGLWAALLAAQETFPAIVRGKTAKVKTRGDGEYSYDYADLTDILAKVGPVLRANGLVLTQPIVSTPDGAAIRSTLVHVPSGEREIADFPLPMDGAGAQQVGSLITYWRRYSAQAILGITTESDSDARDVDVPPRRGARSSGASTSGPRSGSRGSGAASTTSPGVDVLLDELKLAVGKIGSDGGRAEWADWKAEKGWDRLWSEGALMQSRELVEEALRLAREIVDHEAAAKGDEPWDPLTGASCAECGAPGEEHMAGCSNGDAAGLDPEDTRSPGSAGIDGDTGGGSEAEYDPGDRGGRLWLRSR